MSDLGGRPKRLVQQRGLLKITQDRQPLPRSRNTGVTDLSTVSGGLVLIGSWTSCAVSRNLVGGGAGDTLVSALGVPLSTD